MKALLSLLLFFSPLFAAANSPILTFNSGSITFGNGSSAADFIFTGNGFSASGQVGEGTGFPGAFQFPRVIQPGLWNPAILVDTEDSLQMSLVYQGVPLTDAGGGGAGWTLGVPGFGTREFNITGPGMYSEVFTSNGTFGGRPVNQPNAPFVSYVLTGDGIVTINVVPDPAAAGELLITSETFTFTAPEPSSLLLLLAGLGGLGAVRRHRREANLGIGR